jgi:hypothetical protein
MKILTLLSDKCTGAKIMQKNNILTKSHLRLNKGAVKYDDNPSSYAGQLQQNIEPRS